MSMALFAMLCHAFSSWRYGIEIAEPGEGREVNSAACNDTDGSRGTQRREEKAGVARYPSDCLISSTLDAVLRIEPT